MHNRTSLLMAAAAMSIIALGHTPPPIHPAPERSQWGSGRHGGSTKTKPMSQRKHRKPR